MPRMAICSQCQCDLLIPDEMNSATLAECPECGAAVALDAATESSFRIARPIVSHPAAAKSDENFSTAATVPDVSTYQTWDPKQHDHLDTIANIDAAPEPTLEPAQPQPSHEEVGAEDRIDEWFHSAKTTVEHEGSPDEPAELFATRIEDVEDSKNVEDVRDVPIPDFAPVQAGNAKIDLTASDLDGLSAGDDFELEPTAADDGDVQAWDSNEDMDQLLAEIEQPTLEDAKEEKTVAYAPPGETGETNEAEQPSSEAWSPESTATSLLNARKPRKERSLVRTALMTLVGGIFGIAIGYLALLWIRGPEGDFLSVAQALPKAILPSSFDTPSQVVLRPTLPSTPPESSPDDSQTGTESPSPEMPSTETSADETAPIQDDAVSAASATEHVDNQPLGGDPATDELASLASQPQSDDDEPAQIDPLAAEPISPQSDSSTAAAQPVNVAGAPSFTPADVEAALAAAQQAQQDLAGGSLADGDAVKVAKGKAYMTLADLAQKVTFAPAEGGSVTQATELFQTLLSDEHVRGEVAQIAPKWISYANRKHNGAFFAANLARPEMKGSVAECAAELAPGHSVTLLVPATIADQLGSASQPVGVLGWVVDAPSTHVSGYTGQAPKAVFVSRIVKLR